MLTSGDFSENSVAGRWDIFYYDEADTIPAAYANEERFSDWEISKPVELWSSGWVELDSDENGPRSRWNDAKNPGTPEPRNPGTPSPHHPITPAALYAPRSIQVAVSSRSNS